MTDYQLKINQIISEKDYNEINIIYQELENVSKSKIIFLHVQDNSYYNIKYILLNYRKKYINKLIQFYNINDFNNYKLGNLYIFHLNNIDDFDKIVFNKDITNKTYFYKDKDFISFYQSELIYENINLFEIIKKLNI
jgi:hypothetical protein